MASERKDDNPTLSEAVIAEVAGIFKGFIRELALEIQDVENWPPLTTKGQIKRRDQELETLSRSKARIEILQADVMEILLRSNQQFKDTS